MFIWPRSHILFICFIAKFISLGSMQIKLPVWNWSGNTGVAHVGLHHSIRHTLGVSFKASSWLRSSECASVVKHFSSPWPVRLWALVPPAIFLSCWRTGTEMAHNVPLPVFSRSRVSPWSPCLQVMLDFLSQHTLGTHLAFADSGSGSSGLFSYGHFPRSQCLLCSCGTDYFFPTA